MFYNQKDTIRLTQTQSGQLGIYKIHLYSAQREYGESECTDNWIREVSYTILRKRNK